MRIIVIGYNARGGGAETFLREMLPELALQMKDSTIQVMVALSTKDKYSNFPTNVEISCVDDKILDNIIRRVFFDLLVVFSIVASFKPDLIFVASETFSPLLRKLGKPIVILYHSTLQFYMKPEKDESFLRLLYTRTMRDISARLADYMITVSHYVRAEVGMRYKRFRFDKSAVVYHGVNHSVFNTKEIEVKAESAFNYPYILCVSDWHRHKNMPEMIKIFSYIKKKGINEHLVILGRIKNDSVYNSILEQIKSEGLEPFVHLISYIDNHCLVAVYKRASLYWTHTSAESFGMTPLESMACGTPVFAPWREALVEVYGNSIYFYNTFTDTHEEIAERAVDILNKDSLKKQYIERGLLVAHQFSWEDAANQYLKIFKRLVKL